MSEEAEVIETPMPDWYLTPAGRVVSANVGLHRMVVERKGKYGNYVACSENGTPLTGTAMTAQNAELEELRDRIDELLESGDKAYEAGIAKGKEEAEAEAKERIDQAYQNGLKDGREESARLAEKAEAEAKDGEKPAAKKATAKKTSDKKSEG